MYVEIYADIIFLVNLIMDYLIFWIVSRVTKRRIKYFRLFFGALIAASLYCAMIFITFPNMSMNIFFASLMLMPGIATAFYPVRIREFLKLTLLAHVAAFAVGGLCMALFYMNVHKLIGALGNFAIGSFSIKLLLAATCVSYIAISFASRFISKILIHKQIFYSVRVFYNENSADFKALVDTGNSLCDPFTNAPVLIAEFRKLTNILPDGIKLIFYEHRENDLSLLANISDVSIMPKIRMIPFNSVGKENGTLIGFKPDKVVISSANEIVRYDIIVGIYNNALSKDGAYSGLLNPSMLTEA